MYNRGDYLVTEGQTYITDSLGRLILLREHPSPNPNFSIKCSEYFGTNLFNIKTSIQHKQLSLVDGSLVDKTNHAITDFIAVSELKNYSFTGNANFFRVAFYNTSKTFISSSSTDVVFNQRWIENLPTGTKYIRISAEYFTIQDWGLYELTNDRAFAITYFDKKVEVHLTGFYGVTRALIGTPDLFKLKYDSEKKDKSQSILTTQAEINIFEDDYFNIDNLATSGETDIKIQYYESNKLMWNGFVIPDFFQTDISNNRVVQMIAIDRVGILKDIEYIENSSTIIEIVAECLKKTGLNLNIKVAIENSSYLYDEVKTERLIDKSYYEILQSFMVLLNAKVVQYSSEWFIVNKALLEDKISQISKYDSNGTFTGYESYLPEFVTIKAVDVNGTREIKPVATDVSIKMEFGGSRKYPNNWNFQKTDLATIFKDWQISFPANVNTSQVIEYEVVGSVQNAQYGALTRINSLKIRSLRLPDINPSLNILLLPHVKSSMSTFTLVEDVAYKLDIKINFTSASNISLALYVLAKVDDKYYVYGKIEGFQAAGTGGPEIVGKNPINGKAAEKETFGAVQTLFEKTIDINRTQLGISEDETKDIQFQFVIMKDRSYTSPITETDVFIHSTEMILNDGEQNGKGLIFKVKQGGARFTKSMKPEMIYFSPKISRGVNGVFYNYKNDDTSVISEPPVYMPNDIVIKGVRERARMFSKARDLFKLSGDIEVNPLAKYICGDKRFVFIGGESRRKDASIEIEEIVDENLNKIDYIYTYFEN